jgi:hypothetical protein
MLIALIVMLWFACGLGAAGIVCANFNTEDERFTLWSAQELSERKRANMSFSLGWGIFGGPIALLIAVFSTGFAQYGWRLR